MAKSRNARRKAAKRAAVVPPRNRKPKFGICDECHRSVLVEDGVVYKHWATNSRCPGSRRAPYSGPPSDNCSVCGKWQPLRKSDGRIMSHTVRGTKCDGSGKAPQAGRDAKYMNGVGVNAVVSGGAPGLGKR